MFWEYYTKAAEIKGRKSSNGEAVQANYSLLKFFEAIRPEELNSLTKAFLGEQPERERLFDGRDDVQEFADVENYYVESPNESQRRAITMALGEPISFIKGPPGTGKTSTILNLASCIVGRGKTLAVVSSNNEALNNIEDKLKKLEEEGNPLCQRLLQCCKRLGDKRIRQALYEETKEQHSELGNVFHTVTKEGEDGREQVVDWQMDAESFQQIYPMVISTIHSLKPFFTGYACSFDYVIMDESSQTGVVEGVLAMSCAKHLVLVGDEDQLPPVLGMEVEAKIEEMRQQLEGEVPEVYRVTADRSFLDICLEVFAPEIEAYGIKQMLREHYRCHPGIIEFCKREIYDGELEIRTENYDRDVNVPIKILWFEGDYCEEFHKKESKIYGSKTNRAQIAIFMEEELPGLVDRMLEQEEAGEGGDVFVFPHSISEFRPDRVGGNRQDLLMSIMQRMCRKLRKNRVYFLITIRDEESHMARDIDSVCFIKERLDTVGYQRAKLIGVSSEKVLEKMEEAGFGKERTLMPRWDREENVPEGFPNMGAGERLKEFNQFLKEEAKNAKEEGMLERELRTWPPKSSVFLEYVVVRFDRT